MLLSSETKLQKVGVCRLFLVILASLALRFAALSHRFPRLFRLGRLGNSCIRRPHFAHLPLAVTRIFQCLLEAVPLSVLRAPFLEDLGCETIPIRCHIVLFEIINILWQDITHIQKIETFFV